MSLFDLVTNAVEGATQATLGTAKLVASPATQILDPSVFAGQPSHAEKAMEQINEGLDKIGKAD